MSRKERVVVCLRCGKPGGTLRKVGPGMYEHEECYRAARGMPERGGGA